MVVGSGFGGAAAALRFADSGRRVRVLERGDRVTREGLEVDLDYFWIPERQRFGMHDLHRRGDVVPWLGAAVGGGSHVYAGSLFRREAWDGFPAAIADDDIGRYYARAEAMLAPAPYPDYSPYGDTETAFATAARALAARRPELVEAQGRIPLAISFAPPGVAPGARFRNRHGAEQRYYDPDEQSLLGGDIGAKNTLDLNYLYLAEQRGARVDPLCEVDRIEPLDDGGYRVHYLRRRRERGRLRRAGQKWLGIGGRGDHEQLTAETVVLAAGAIGTTELLLRNRDLHRTLPRLSPALGSRYSSNGDFVSAMIAAGEGDTDRGPTNVHYIRFRARDGSAQGAYVESGRYPTPIKLGAAIALSALGRWRPDRYPRLLGLHRHLRNAGDPPGWLARHWPMPLLQMGRDDAFGRVSLDARGRATIAYDRRGNRAYYAWLDELGRLIAGAGGARWLPNAVYRATGLMEIPHNLGGAPMADDPAHGVVDDRGRVFGYPGLLVLDGSMVPVAIGPNPALTILALVERALATLAA